MTNAELRKLFRKYNRKYFDGKLKPSIVRFKKIRDLGICYQFADGTGEIHISTDIQRWPLVTCMTLLHECVHLFLPPTVHHGPRFEKEMKRLARESAFRGLW